MAGILTDSAVNRTPLKAVKNDILGWDQKYRLRFMNSISGYKGVHLIGTKSGDGVANLAIFNSVLHIGANPPLMGFVMRPLIAQRDTYQNIKESGYFTINHVHKSFTKKAHYTSAKIDADQSEFEVCDLEEQYLGDFPAPFVGESKIKVGLKWVEEHKIEANGTVLVVGEVQILEVEDDCVEDSGQLDLSKVHDVLVTGLNQYSAAEKMAHYPYARASEMPDFRQKERPDNVVFDEESQEYNASILPYGTNIGAPSIQVDDVSSWKNRGITSTNHVLGSKVDKIKKDYLTLMDEYKVNELLYSAKMRFEPDIGAAYYLYSNPGEDRPFLSLIPPEQWQKECLGSFRLNHDLTWTRLDEKQD